jgi:hypothetical protein
MKFDKDKLKNDAIKLIIENKLIFVEDVFGLLGISKQTFYNYFPVEFDDFDELSKLLTQNKINTKKKLRQNWENQPTNAAMQLALYKLCSVPEEHRLLQQTYTENKNENQEKIIIDWSDDNPNPNDNQTTETN